jgi:hypothetical protein
VFLGMILTSTVRIPMATASIHVPGMDYKERAGNLSGWQINYSVQLVMPVHQLQVATLPRVKKDGVVRCRRAQSTIHSALCLTYQHGEGLYVPHLSEDGKGDWALFVGCVLARWVIRDVVKVLGDERVRSTPSIIDKTRGTSAMPGTLEKASKMLTVSEQRKYS